MNARERFTTHGYSGTPTYVTWTNMNQRCSNINRKDWERYGGRGIRVCERWKNSFENFLEDMGKKPDFMSLDRINNSGDYEPTNCRWATIHQQSVNKRNNVFVTINGSKKTLSEAAKEIGIPVVTLHYRIRNAKWKQEDACTREKFQGCQFKRSQR
jgi:hypothetical protein